MIRSSRADALRTANDTPQSTMSHCRRRRRQTRRSRDSSRSRRCRQAARKPVRPEPWLAAPCIGPFAHHRAETRRQPRSSASLPSGHTQQQAAAFVERLRSARTISRPASRTRIVLAEAASARRASRRGSTKPSPRSHWASRRNIVRGQRCEQRLRRDARAAGAEGRSPETTVSTRMVDDNSRRCR